MTLRRLSAGWREVMDEVLDPGVVRVAGRRDAARAVATTADQRVWNAAFRRFLRDLGAGDLDESGERYRTRWYIHDCITDDHGACVDTVLVPAYHTLRARGWTFRIICAGDQDRPTGRPIVAAPNALAAKW